MKVKRNFEPKPMCLHLWLCNNILLCTCVAPPIFAVMLTQYLVCKPYKLLDTLCVHIKRACYTLCSAICFVWNDNVYMACAQLYAASW